MQTLEKNIPNGQQKPDKVNVFSFFIYFKNLYLFSLPVFILRQFKLLIMPSVLGPPNSQ